MLNKRYVAALGIAIVVVAVVYLLDWLRTDNEPFEPSLTTAQETLSESALATDGIDSVPKLIRTAPPPSAVTKDHVIQFDNGRQIAVELKNRTGQPFYFEPTEKFVDMYVALEQAALSGEATAATQLYMHLKACSTVPETEEAMSQVLLRISEDGLMPNRKGDGLEPTPEGFDYEVYAQRLDKAFRFCEGISAEQRQDYKAWAEMAAYSGDYFGIRFLTEELGPGPESYKLWKIAWSQGHINAATASIIHFRHGYWDQSTGQPDYVQTYAWQLIRNKVYDAAYGFASRPIPQRSEAMAAALDATAGYLTPHQQREAENLAADLLEANPNCCIGSWPW